MHLNVNQHSSSMLRAPLILLKVLFTYFILLKAEVNWLKGSVGLLRLALHRVPVLMVVVEASQGAAAVAGLRRAVARLRRAVADHRVDVTSRLSDAGFLILH